MSNPQHIQSRAISVRRVLENPESDAYTLYLVAAALFGAAVLHGRDSWSSKTIALEFRDEIRASLPPINLDKIEAVRTLVESSAFYRDVRAFRAICNTLGEAGPATEGIDEETPMAEEILWALIISELTRGKSEDLPFSREVEQELQRAYAGPRGDSRAYLEGKLEQAVNDLTACGLEPAARDIEQVYRRVTAESAGNADAADPAAQ